MPGNFLALGLIHAAQPNARIIPMRRHPIDTRRSIHFRDFEAAYSYAHDLGHLARYYGDYLRLMEHWRAVLPADSLLNVSYQQRVGDQESWSRRRVAFIGLPWDAQCLNFAHTRRTIITASNWQVRQKISTASIGRWRNYRDYLGPLMKLAPAGPELV